MSVRVKFVLLANYYYGRLMGVINFEIDFRTGRARLTKVATIYAAAMNIFCLSLFALIIKSRIWRKFVGSLNEFYDYVFITVLVLRISCVFVTMLNRWWQRQQIIQLLNQFRGLVLEQPKVIRMWRRGVISKCITGMLSELSQMLLPLYALRATLTASMALGLITMSVLVALLNIIISQYYFAVLNVHGHYVLCNEELRLILRETQSLESDYRKGVRNLRSCALADRIDSLALRQSALQALLHKMTRIFGIQILCMGTVIYISFIASLYTSFLAVKYKLVGTSFFTLENQLYFLGVCSYIADVHISYSITYYLEDQYEKMRHLVMQYSSLAPTVDRRLTTAFESFQLQLVRDPQELSVLGLFNMNRKISISMLSSMITYSLILIQYDIKNY
ncbi:putative gustatory receptor 59d [Drosophila nasuta]|uniref:putative gustatory receptor 59d n=1 Tax=Drosophila nasuta TaxID=42062 RepID=UPI00295EBAD9|nr:putative gustatory receptor 59d [Drosophila nasuta]